MTAASFPSPRARGEGQGEGLRGRASAPRNRRSAGFTLVELTVAMGIAVLMFASVVYGVGALTGAKAKESANDLANAIRTLYDTAALTGKTCRLVFQLPEGREDESAVKWHAECAKGGITAGAKRDDELREAHDKEKDKDRLKKDDRFKRMDSDGAPSMQELMAREKDRVEEAAKFTTFASDDINERTLPSNVKIQVWTAKQRDPVKTGPAYLYFFPQGFTERAMVFVRQGSNVWTIAVSPLTGKTSVVGEELEVPRS